MLNVNMNILDNNYYSSSEEYIFLNKMLLKECLVPVHWLSHASINASQNR